MYLDVFNVYTRYPQNFSKLFYHVLQLLVNRCHVKKSIYFAKRIDNLFCDTLNCAL